MEKLKSIETFVLDMDGTVYLEGDIFPFTKEFLKTVTKCGKKYSFFTNNSSSNRRLYTEKLKNMGIEVRKDEIYISSDVAIRYIKENYSEPRVFLMGTPALRESFEDEGVLLDDESPNIMVLGFDTTLCYDRLNKFCQFVRSGVDYIGVNCDLNCPLSGGKFMPDCGSMAKLVEASTGRYPEFFGKPSRHTLEFMKEKTNTKEENLAFVGDRLYTDIAITKNTKATSIFVLTGEGTYDEAVNGEHKPDLIMSSLKEIDELLKKIYNV